MHWRLVVQYDFGRAEFRYTFGDYNRCALLLDFIYTVF